MPHEGIHAGSPQDWLRYARSDLALARTRKSRVVLYQHLCFHAQQAAEKSLKAVLCAKGKPFPRTHDLAFLLDALPDAISIPPALVELPTLTKYAVQHRYPGECGPVTQRQRARAVQLAAEAVAWASRLAEATGQPLSGTGAVCEPRPAYRTRLKRAKRPSHRSV